jgi:hypothetical protein
VALGVGGCGSSRRAPPSPDRITLQRVDRLLSTLTQLEGQINIDPVNGTTPRKNAEYVRTETPLIDQFGRTSQALSQQVASLQDAEGARLYAPLAEANDRAAKDLGLFLNAVVARDGAGARRAATQVAEDERRINQVALAQLPKARAYALKLDALS